MAVTQISASRLDLVEQYFAQRWTDGLPVVPPTPEKVAAVVDALGGEPELRGVPRRRRAGAA